MINYMYQGNLPAPTATSEHQSANNGERLFVSEYRGNPVKLLRNNGGAVSTSSRLGRDGIAYFYEL